MTFSSNIWRSLWTGQHNTIRIITNVTQPSVISRNSLIKRWKCVHNIRNYSNAALASASSQLKKQPFKKKIEKAEHIEMLKVSACTTTREFDMDDLHSTLKFNSNYELTPFNTKFDVTDNVLHFTVPGRSGESKDVFVFREGSVVCWNIDQSETSNLLKFLKAFYKNSLDDVTDIKQEDELMPYSLSSDVPNTVIRGGVITLTANKDETLEKFAVSNAMALSVHLGAYEALLGDYIESMLPVTEDLKSGRTIKMTQKEVLRKMGQLFALRHVINLSSDLLDTPDFYWDHEELENLYQRTFNYFCIGRRTKVMNEKINHCIELVELLSTQLSDAHHVRLEWMIIILIMVEVAFEVFHYAMRFLSPSEV